MRESVVRDFFDGVGSGSQLAAEAREFLKQCGASVIGRPICDLTSNFEVSRNHLVGLCDAAVRGELDGLTLHAVGLFLLASDHFGWQSDTPDGGLVAQTVHEWAAPEINLELTLDNIDRFRERLVTGRDTFPESQN